VKYVDIQIITQPKCCSNGLNNYAGVCIVADGNSISCIPADIATLEPNMNFTYDSQNIDVFAQALKIIWSDITNYEAIIMELSVSYEETNIHIWHGETDLATTGAVGGIYPGHVSVKTMFLTSSMYTSMYTVGRRGIKITFHQPIEYYDLKLFIHESFRSGYGRVCLLANGIKISCTPDSLPDSGEFISFKTYNLKHTEKIVAERYRIMWEEEENNGYAHAEDLYFYYIPFHPWKSETFSIADISCQEECSKESDYHATGSCTFCGGYCCSAPSGGDNKCSDNLVNKYPSGSATHYCLNRLSPSSNCVSPDTFKFWNLAKFNGDTIAELTGHTLETCADICYETTDCMVFRHVDQSKCTLKSNLWSSSSFSNGDRTSGVKCSYELPMDAPRPPDGTYHPSAIKVKRCNDIVQSIPTLKRSWTLHFEFLLTDISGAVSSLVHVGAGDDSISEYGYRIATFLVASSGEIELYSAINGKTNRFDTHQIDTKKWISATVSQTMVSDKMALFTTDIDGIQLSRTNTDPRDFNNVKIRIGDCDHDPVDGMVRHLSLVHEQMTTLSIRRPFEWNMEHTENKEFPMYKEWENKILPMYKEWEVSYDFKIWCIYTKYY